MPFTVFTEICTRIGPLIMLRHDFFKAAKVVFYLVKLIKSFKEIFSIGFVIGP